MYLSLHVDMFVVVVPSGRVQPTLDPWPNSGGVWLMMCASVCVTEG